MEKTYLSIQSSLTVIVLVGIFFIILGYLNSKKLVNNKNYIEKLKNGVSNERSFIFIEDFQEVLSLLHPNSHKS